MTQEEKAQAYDEALNKAKIEINTKGIGETVDLCKQLFPELFESEDENLKNKSGYYKAGKFWKASTLWNATKNKIPQRVSNRYILQECTWNIGTLQRFANEVKNVQEVSLDYPIILDMNGNILDGAHRVVKAYLEGKDIDIVYLGDDEWPEPDYDEEKAVKESEDERIINQLITLVNSAGEVLLIPTNKEELVAWLNKCKESLHTQETCKENADSFTDGIIEVRSFQRGMEEGRKLEKQEEQKPVECIEFDNEFEKQVSHLLASVLNGEWEYNEDFVKYAAQSLLGFAKNEMKPDEWDKREKLFRKALQAANARIGQLFEENQKLKEQKLEKYAQRLQKEQKQAQTSDEKEYVRTIKSIISDFIRDKKPENLAYYQRIYDWLDGRHVPISCGHENGEPADPVFSKQEYESHPIISTDTTSVKPVELDGKALLYTADKSYQIGFRDGVASVKPAEWSEEDEEMRDTCIDLLKHFPRPCGEVIGPWKDCTAWLKSLPEKFNLQSKQECGKVTINGEPVSAENHSVDIPLAEWSKEDEEIYTFVCNFFETCWWSKTWDISREQVLQMLKSLPEKFVLQPKQEWDVEDKLMIKCCLEAINVYKHKAKRGKFLPARFNIGGYLASPEKVESWLKFLPGRFNLQSKQEWSDEDDQLIGFIFDLLNSLVWRKEWAMDKKECLERLKSLRPQPHWKPSKEQMDRLFSIVAALRKAYCDDMADFLSNLYADLKKLM